MIRSLAVTLLVSCMLFSRGAAQGITLDSARHTVVMRAGPFTAEPAEHGHEGHADMLHGDDFVRRFEWPCDAWLRGFALRLEDAEGRPLPLRWIHHLKVVNFARRQLVYPITERLMNRVVAVYDNPTADTIPGAMGILGGLFAPDDLRRWPSIDPSNADYRLDMDVLGSPARTAHRTLHE